MAAKNVSGFSEGAVLWNSANISGFRDPDAALRLEIFQYLRELGGEDGLVTAAQLSAGYIRNDGEHVALITRPRGIFKPRQMSSLLSIKTVVPRSGRGVWYDDQREAHNQIYNGREAVSYSFMGQNPDAGDNLLLKQACDAKIPVVYFLGISPGVYEVLLPTFVDHWSADDLKVRLVFGNTTQDKLQDEIDTSPPKNDLQRRYALTAVKRRLHQDAFRQAVIHAYGGRCAFSGLPVPILLDAAHIVADKHELLGQPVVTNGIPLSKTHHAAFDAHLIGIDPDYKIHVSQRLLLQKDGPMLEALKDLKGSSLRRPTREKDYPDKDRLAVRFGEYRSRL
ncbi:MAG: HNH endonuclease [Ferrovibrio sp.]|uniref:HNH endonuclease n=1 Tax=Ferrovibrio sp. TaxID=1917215 RepID=UPI00262AAF64|nr:HNH endonuclease [Ferrovibrio sp.]MCW0234129.1 HNH endonuclease [Ferrovibrio sp.]